MKITSLSVVLMFLSIALQGQQKAAPVVTKVSGKEIYTLHCQTCHQVDGAGAQNMIPPLSKTSYVTGQKERLIRIVLHGLTGKITVNGDIYESEMPPQNTLTDQEIAAVLSYVRSSFGNKASAVREEEVKKVRASNKKSKEL